MSVILGIDTGGTYTDSVLFDPAANRVVEKAKARTTHHDLILGIAESVNQLRMSEPISMVCLSTTLATNSMVEGKGGKVALLVLGSRLRGEKFPSESTTFMTATMDIKGRVVNNLESTEVEYALQEVRRANVDAVAISGFASVRNPRHELEMKEYASKQLGLPVVCAHELSSALGFYDRTVTAVLNARLIPVIKELIQATSRVLERCGINAPVMIVKGDGSLMQADYAVNRPIETVLSGPAASISGAMYLAGLCNGTVMDMGGTTTDIITVRDGTVRILNEGATVGGWKTQTRAAEIYTYGIGGDSHIRVENGNLKIGPERVRPACLAKKLLNFGGNDSVGLTPTDLRCLAGTFCDGDASDAKKQCNKVAGELGIDVESFLIIADEAVTDKICCAYLSSATNLSDGVPIIGIGAPARDWMPKAAKKLGVELVVPENAEVANAVGAAVGQVVDTYTILIRPSALRDGFIVHAPDCRREFTEYDEAITFTESYAASLTHQRMNAAGCVNYEYDAEEQLLEAEDGTFIETKYMVSASGLPMWRTN